MNRRFSNREIIDHLHSRLYLKESAKKLFFND